MSRRSVEIERKIRQYQGWQSELQGGKAVLRAKRPDRDEAMLAVTQPGKCLGVVSARLRSKTNLELMHSGDHFAVAGIKIETKETRK